ncbi:type II toxin-antitoxin system RatA family toxin [Lamprobacter modestohalophilus]|uniref:type II toxin-antitoxin system RatA family toxin n=1 Tax=Lamprobacter modestohalophilus TaxID=1064514 RepID=UPI002ADED3AB|nr:type II toxin-antitoxin system RatA family toxin [Lamprobacter modestohalophilus]MCF7979743.1 type II toxin-antitoxin system RatA family toxin [Chromatiaceae bacterium]MCF8014651.1 type II toxin-antitoxin system RatA family toxin [Chromatiaceae bacterium]MEA1050375.1 type II toxin-antitoxin system RatA family toxin [Lamprobacter modestohalophilus]
MPLVKKSALVRHSAQQMFDLVADVEGYPRFLPWCHSATLLSRDEHELCGRIEVARLGVRQVFSTCNKLEPPERMYLRLKDGPFRKLSGVWTFTHLREDACKVELQLDFEFSGRLIDKAFGGVFGQIANSMVDAFCKRADEVYGD